MAATFTHSGLAVQVPNWVWIDLSDLVLYFCDCHVRPKGPKERLSNERLKLIWVSDCWSYSNWMSDLNKGSLGLHHRLEKARTSTTENTMVRIIHCSLECILSTFCRPYSSGHDTWTVLLYVGTPSAELHLFYHADTPGCITRLVGPHPRRCTRKPRD